MTVISSEEFVANIDKYLDMALNDNVIIQRGDNMFIVKHYIPNEEPDMIFEPDEDFYRSITMDELHESAKEHIHKLFENQ